MGMVDRLRREEGREEGRAARDVEVRLMLYTTTKKKKSRRDGSLVTKQLRYR